VLGQRGESSAATVITLRVVAISGEVVLERKIVLRPEDCPSAPELIATVLEHFLHDVPRSVWTELPRQPAATIIVVGRELPWVAAVARTSMAARWPGPGADLEVGLALETGTRSGRLMASATARIGTPQRLGVGRIVDGVTAAGVGWRRIGTASVAALEFKVGGRFATGYDYRASRTDWLPWLEVSGGIAWPWHGLLVGPVLAVSPLRQRAVTTAGAETTLPYLRAGVCFEVPLVVDLL
jgi:hypothetical protein